MNGPYPVEFEAKNSNEFPIVHLQIDTQFVGDSGKESYPSSVFISFEREGMNPYTAHADYISEI